MFDVAITVAEEVTIWYDLTTILSTMIACSATFVAIIGGLIANKAIADNTEKEAIDRQLQQIDTEIQINNSNIDELSKLINQYYAFNFINTHLADLLDGVLLSNIYDADDNNDLEYEELLVFWDSALCAVKKFRDSRLDEENNDGIPKDILDELDSFQYEICSRYKMSIRNDTVNAFETTIIGDSYEYPIKYHNENVDKMDDLEIQNERLFAKKELLKDRRDAIGIGENAKSGMRVFSIVSITNIILPIIFMLFNPTTNRIWYITETALSIATFAVGIIVMIKYIYSLFPKKDEKYPDAKGTEQEHV